MTDNVRFYKLTDFDNRCDDDDGTIYLKKGQWGGEVNGRLVTYFCPPDYCRCEGEGDLPGCVFKPKHVDNQCNHNRTGVLCGKCQQGLSVGLRWVQTICILLTIFYYLHLLQLAYRRWLNLDIYDHCCGIIVSVSWSFYSWGSKHTN